MNINKLRAGISGMVTVGLLASSILTVSATADTTSVNTLIQNAQKSNIDMVLLQTQLGREIDDYETALAISHALDSNRDIHDALSFSDAQAIELTPLEAKKDLLDKKYEILKKEDEITYDSYNMVYTYFNLLEDQTSKKDYYDYMDEKRLAKKSELDLGQITQLEYDEIEKEYQSAYIDYIEATNALDKQIRTINIYLDLEPSNPLDVVKTDMPVKSMENMDLEALTNEIVENSYQVDQLELEKEIKELELKYKQRNKGFGETKIEMSLLEDEIVELEAQIEDMKRSLKSELYTKYNDAMISLKNIEISQLQYDLAKRTYDINEVKYANGLVSVLDLTESRRSFESSYYNINSAKLASFLKIEEFYNFLNENKEPMTIE